MKQKHDKTNAMRMLDRAGVSYEYSEYDYDESDLSGAHVAMALNLSEDEIFKTLVTVGNDGQHRVFVIPVSCDLDLKKAAAAAGVKRIEMIPVKELFSLTGYLRGGCSPLGMKKLFPTYLDETAILFPHIYLSAGRRGAQIVLNAEVLAELIGAEFTDLVKD